MMNARQLQAEYNARAQTASLQVQCPGDGNTLAEIAIVSEAPGEREVAMRVPQMGSGGQFLWGVLRKYAIHRSAVWTTNVVKRRLLGTDDQKESITSNEFTNWKALLEWELAQLPNLKYIICLGSLALRALTGDDGITKWRGSVVPYRPGVSVHSGTALTTVPQRNIQVVCAFNPAIVMREPKWDVVFRFDMHKLDRVMKGKHKPSIITAHINPSPDEAIRWLDRMESSRDPVSYDIETIAGETACVGFADCSTEGMCISFRTLHTQTYSVQDELRVRLRMADLFANPQVKFVAQNGSFDMSWLWWRDRIRVLSTWFDTLLGHHTLYPQLPHNLGFLTSQYTDDPYYKDEKSAWREGGDIDQFWRYNVRDCCTTIAVQQRILNELRTQKLDGFFFNHVMRLQPELVKMSMQGVACDPALKEIITDEFRDRCATALDEFNRAVATATSDTSLVVNPRSPKQLSKLFFTTLRLVGRGTSTNEANRARMRNHPRTSGDAKAVIDALNDYAKANKFLGTYAECETDDDGRLRCEYKQYGTQQAPGRLSSTQTHWDTGMNFQNQTERSKRMFTADKNIVFLDGKRRRFRFVYFDMEQAEARIVAWLVPIPSWIEQFERARMDGSYDCHRALASQMFGKPYEECPSYDQYKLGTNTDDPALDGKPTIRYIAKRCRHGLNYRMGPDRLAEVTGLSLHEAMAHHATYHRITPELSRIWWPRTVKEVKETKQLWTPMGRRWINMERFDENSEVMESIIAFVPQSTLGDKVSSVQYQAPDDPDWPRDEASIVINNHDALIAQVPDDDDMASHCLRILKRHAEAPIIINGRPLIIPADTKWSVPVVWDDEKRMLVPHPEGRHYWSNMVKVKVNV